MRFSLPVRDISEKEVPARMKSKLHLVLSLLVVGATSFALFPRVLAGKTESVRGWLSDEDCAKGRAESGTYTQTNGECAKQCVAKGKRIVLIDPTGKRILVIVNQDVAKKNVGNYVEVSGAIDSQARTIKVDSVKFLGRNQAMCGVPPSKNAQQKQP
jgi:hypothetical protein